ncbi:ASCH domain-containing protein [Desulfosporosinus youngiae]|uniref:ASCH domain-containing protein n=1 Tax=Desulfosporosinus youngiae DSM 17734 TaxID=768710 RepID=H5Y288_9FIRM|nr:ASCH domain-containing protein [Desulfosporosinus youngiae]EHQ88436.1 ASCH domain-containing protein [Desulfosporosinus youngiae DSM 17734]
MKAISLLQPWASLIATGAKKIETRSWATKYRGPLAIHASKGYKAKNLDMAWKEPFFAALESLRVTEENGDVSIRFPHGSIIATCNLVDCVKMTPEFIDFVKSANGHEYDFGEYAVGRYAWILEDIKALDNPVPAKGKLSIWEWDGELL